MKLYNEKNEQILTNLDADSIDSVVTDPPYGWSFMGKKWDYDVPNKSLWELVYRVLKPGGHMLVCCGTRTQHRMVVNIEDAGFEIRDVVIWIHGEGFPKSTDLGDGWGTALKPAAELWTLCRKPVSEKTVIENREKYGTGGINIDESRIETDQDLRRKQADNKHTATPIASNDGYVSKDSVNKGRWPANVILDEEAGKIMDDQTQDLHKAGNVKVSVITSYSTFTSGSESREVRPGFGDFGGASRFFYTAKARKGERSFWCKKCERADDDQKPHRGHEKELIFHPTQKPLTLMEYLVKMITPPKGIVLDPYMGSGTTMVAAKLHGFDYVGIEDDKHYFRFAEWRIKNTSVTTLEEFFDG